MDYESDLDVADAAEPRRTILVLMFAGMACLAVLGAPSAMSAMFIKSEMGLDNEQVGRFLVSSVWGIPPAFAITGLIAQRVGYRIPIAVGLILELTGMVVVVLASNLTMLLVGNVLVGFGAGMWGMLLTPIAFQVSPSQPTRLSNYLHAMFSLGQILIATIAWQMLALGLPWQSIYYALFGITFVFLLLVLSVRWPKPRRDKANYLPLKRFVLTGPFLLMLLAMFFSTIHDAIDRWIPTLISSEVKGSLLQTWLGFTCFGVAMGIGRLSAGAVVHRLGVKWTFVIGCLGSVVCMLLASQSNGVVVTIFWSSLVGLSTAFFYPTVMGYAQDRYPKAGPSMFSALSTAGTLGAITWPWVAGWLAMPPHNIQYAIGCLAIMPLVLLACILIISRCRTIDV